MFTKADHFSVS